MIAVTINLVVTVIFCSLDSMIWLLFDKGVFTSQENCLNLDIYSHFAAMYISFTIFLLFGRVPALFVLQFHGLPLV